MASSSQVPTSSVNKCSAPTRVLAVLSAILLFTFLGRFAFLEFLDLLDPTESRYAFVSQQMVLSGNWLTPMLPEPEGLVPYLGKPPLHFWLTAFAYELFGIEEWTSRLSSLLGTALLCFCLYLFARRWLDQTTAAIATLLTATSGMMFFLSGASVVDVTLASIVTIGVLFAYAAVTATNDVVCRRFFLGAFVCAGLGFLTKGPYAFVLMGLPFFFWSLVRRDFSWLRTVPWIQGAAVLALVIIPWFVVSERAHPGFLNYFIWTENIGRYLHKDYGDRYGSGHVQIYGTAWVMLLLAFLPWTLLWLTTIRKGGWNTLRASFSRNDLSCFLLCWTVATPIFLTFMRQYHAMYVLPAVPPFAMLTALLIQRKVLSIPTLGLSGCRIRLLISVIAVALTLGVVGAALKFSFVSVLATGAVLAAAAFALRQVDGDCQFSSLARMSLLVVSLYLCVLASGAPYVNNRRSSEAMLEFVATETDCGAGALGQPHSVGVSSHNAYSVYWIAQAAGELSRKLSVQYVAPAAAKESSVCHYLVKKRSLDQVPAAVKDHYRFVRHMGDWQIFVRPDAVQPQG